MNNLIGKRGEERIFTIWWFVVIVAVSAVVVLVTIGFFSKESNTMEYESNILYERIVECLVENGNLRQDFNKDLDIYQECSFSKKVFDESGLFYYSIYFKDELVFMRLS